MTSYIRSSRARATTRAALLLATTMLTACWSASRTTKALSFAPFAERVVDGQPLPEHLTARTVRLLISLRPTARKGVFQSESTATAIPITDDGYLLTAAHAIDRESEHRSFVVFPGSLQPRPFRVVWNGFTATSAHLDLAVIHVDAPPPAFFAWAPQQELKTGSSLVSAGFVSEELTFAAGELHDDLHSDGHVAWRVTHSVPLADGDSGGPLCTPTGQLVAVNYGSTALTPIGGVLYCIALRPDLDWLEGLLARDRREHK